MYHTILANCCLAWSGDNPHLIMGFAAAPMRPVSVARRAMHACIMQTHAVRASNPFSLRFELSRLTEVLARPPTSLISISPGLCLTGAAPVGGFLAANQLQPPNQLRAGLTPSSVVGGVESVFSNVVMIGVSCSVFAWRASSQLRKFALL